MDEISLLSFIQEIYSTVLEPAGWLGLPAALARLFDTHSGIIQQHKIRTGEMMFNFTTANVDHAAGEAYRIHYASRDVLMNGLLARPQQNVVLSQEIIDENAYANSEIYNGLTRRLGMFHSIGVALPSGNHALLAIALQRAHTQAPFDETDRRRMNIIASHLRSAARIREHIELAELQRDAALDGLDRLKAAALVVDPEARILFANKGALAVLSRGNPLGARTGRLVADGAGSATLFHLIQKCCLTATARGADPAGAVLLKHRSSAQLGILVAPLPGSREAAILFLREQTGDPPPRAGTLQTLYGFTPTEAEIAVRLVAGDDPEEIAAGKRISMNTLRTHLKNIMAKADVHRQSELMALILKGVSPLDRA